MGGVHSAPQAARGGLRRRGQRRRRGPVQPWDLPDAPTHRPVPSQHFPDVPTTRATTRNQLGVAVDAGKVFGAKPVDGPVWRVCVYFNTFWSLMAQADPGASASPELFAKDYRRFFSRFCDVNRQGVATYGATRWQAWQHAFARTVLSTRVIENRAYGEELLAREMFARYVVGPGPACTTQTHADGPSSFYVDLSDIYRGKGTSPMKYMEVHSSPASLRASPLFAHLRPVDGVWSGNAWTACRAAHRAYPQRKCDTNALIRWTMRDDATDLVFS